MRIFKTKWFARWARKGRLSDAALRNSVQEMDDGLIDAKLSDFVYKKRIALPGRGKRGSARTILAFKAKDKSFFVFGYAKNDSENIGSDELRQLKILATKLLNYSDEELELALKEKELLVYHSFCKFLDRLI